MASLVYGNVSNQEKLILMTLTLLSNMRSGGGGYASTATVCELTGTINDSRVRQVLHTLHRKGLVIRRIRGKRNYVWSVSDEIREAIERAANEATTFYVYIGADNA